MREAPDPTLPTQARFLRVSQGGDGGIIWWEEAVLPDRSPGAVLSPEPVPTASQSQ